MIAKYEINIGALLIAFLFGAIVALFLFQDLPIAEPLTPEPAIYIMPVCFERQGKPLCTELSFKIVEAEIVPVAGREPVGEMVARDGQ